MKKRSSRNRFPGYIKVLIPLIPFLTAFLVFVIYYLNLPVDKRGQLAFLDAFFDSIGIYSFKLETKTGFSNSILNNLSMPLAARWVLVILGELARIGGLLVTAGFFYALLRRSFQRIANIYHARRKDSIALHGDPALVGLLKKELGSRAITSGDDVAMRAAGHVLLYRSQKEMLSYLEQNYAAMTQNPNARIWLYASGPIHDQGIDSNITVTDVPDSCARLYWQKHWLRPAEKNVVLIGFGAYGQQLLNEALCTNIYPDPDRRIHYHVFGRSGDYRLQHPQLERFLAIDCEADDRDSVFFYSAEWASEPELIRQADRVILCEDDTALNLEIMDRMIALRMNTVLHVRLQNDSLLKSLWKSERLAENRLHPGGTMQVAAFGTDRELYTFDRVTNESLYHRARMIHAWYYFTAVRGIPAEKIEPMTERLQDPGFVADWNNLSAYYRDSSMKQDSHAYVKTRILLNCWDEDVKGRAKEACEIYHRADRKEKERYWELEHRRWEREMYLTGWSYDAVRNNDLLHHNMLVPFECLQESDKLKDANAYEMLKYLDE